jgi:cytochrome oxidase Cu insertion factor (SCO1/SenC/PrrC family)
VADTPTPAAPLDPAATLARYAVPGEPPAGALDLTADDGTRFDLAALHGRPVLVYFGYTSCPDVCPATTGVLAEVVRASVDQPRVVFVTVDLERDTADVLHRYLSYLPAGFVGLTGSAAAVRTAADAYGVDYARRHRVGERLHDGAHGRRHLHRRGRPRPGALPLRHGRDRDLRARAQVEAVRR